MSFNVTGQKNGSGIVREPARGWGGEPLGNEGHRIWCEGGTSNYFKQGVLYVPPLFWTSQRSKKSVPRSLLCSGSGVFLDFFGGEKRQPRLGWGGSGPAIFAKE